MLYPRQISGGVVSGREQPCEMESRLWARHARQKPPNCFGFAKGRPSGTEGSKRRKTKRRREEGGELLELFAHHVAGELCQNLPDRIHQSLNRKSLSEPSGFAVQPHILCHCVKDEERLNRVLVYHFCT